jgi:hypothetical protein
MNEQKRPGVSLVKFMKRLLAAPFVLLAAIVILLEDWLWDDLARLAATIGRLPVFRFIETFIIGLPPYAALLLFAAPSLLLLPVKLAALYFMSHGQATLGLVTVIAAKVIGTALVARIFTLTRATLMRVGWFAWTYERFIAFKIHIYKAIKSTAIYRLAHQHHLRIGAALKAWMSMRRNFLRRRWDAARKLSRRQKQEQE